MTLFFSHRAKRLLAVILFALPLFLVSTSLCRAQETKPIIIGILPEMNVFKQKQRFEPLMTYLSKKIGIPVELTMLSRYGNIIERLRDQKIDAAFLGSFTGALAIAQLKVEPLARPVNLDDTSTYVGYIFVRKDSNIKTVADMKDKILVLVERATTAGYVFPLAWFKRHGVDDPIHYFKEKYFAGSHDATIDAVLNGQADVGAGKNTVYDRIRETNPRVERELEILAISPPVPSNGLCVRPGLSEQTKNLLKKSLLELDTDPEGIKVLATLGAKRFVETKREDYQPVIDLADEAELNLKGYQYYNP